MKCTIEDQKLMQQYAPALFPKLVEFDRMIQPMGFEISLRDSDHTYNSFCYGVYPIDKYDASRSEEQSMLNEQLRKLISSTCCMCGSDFHVSLGEFDDRMSSDIFEHKCLLCQAKAERSAFKRILKYAMANTFAKKENRYIQLPQIKIRLLNCRNEIFYDYLSNLYVEEGSFYISNRISKHEKVKYAGMSLGARDVNGERLYEGDLVVAILAETGHRYWGMAYKNTNELLNPQPKNPMIPSDILLEHGDNNFPSPLTLAESFEIVGNIFQNQKSDLSQSKLRLDLPTLKKCYNGLASMYDASEYSNYFSDCE